MTLLAIGVDGGNENTDHLVLSTRAEASPARSVDMAAIHPVPQLLSVTTHDNPVTTYEVKYNEVVTEKTEVTITGNFPPKLLTNFEKLLTGKQLSDIFAMS